MAASSWDTLLASKQLLQTHGSVAGVKAAAASDPTVVTPLTTGLAAWKELPQQLAAAAKEVDIVIPVCCEGRAPHATEDHGATKARAWKASVSRSVSPSPLTRARAAPAPAALLLVVPDHP